MSENQEETYAKACREIEKLREENSTLREGWLELKRQMLSYTGLPGQLQRINVKMKELKSLIVRAADALEKSPDVAHSQLAQELRKAAE